MALKPRYEFLPTHLKVLDPRWPSGFRTLLLREMAAASPSGLLCLCSDPEDLYAELSSLGEEGWSLVLVTDEGVEGTVLPDQTLLVLAPAEFPPERVLHQLGETPALLVRPGMSLSMEALMDALVASDYQRVGYAEVEGEFARRGGILDVYPKGRHAPVRIEFFGDLVESLREFDPVSQKSLREIPEFAILLKGLPGDRLPFLRLHRSLRVIREGTAPDVAVEPPPRFAGRFDLFLDFSRDYLRRGYRLLFFGRDRGRLERLREILPAEFYQGELGTGFILPREKVAVFSESEVLGRKPARRRIPPSFGERVEDLSALTPGDYVVHEDFGIARYEGLERTRVGEGEYDCLRLRYRDGFVLVPVYNLDRVQRFVSDDDTPPILSELSGRSWAVRKARAQVAAQKLAMELLRTAAIRKAGKGFRFSPDDALMAQLEAEFPFEETEDQLRAIEEVKRDMESDKVMDRLIAGEVGFGKTEVALRAAFKAALDGKQVAVLVPTTVLAYQHFRTFRQRLARYPVRVEMVSRLIPPKRVKEILRDLAEGKVDIVIGTHRLLMRDVAFHDLGLLIIDEEHRFGVAQKEKLKMLFPKVDTLKLTATPIPRTLYAALGRVYDLSVIQTPPLGRLPVETVVAPWSRERIREAISRELARGGQVFYVHNRIEELPEVAEMLQGLFPHLRIGVAHGKTPKRQLEDTLIQFLEGKLDLLLSTSIIEAGVDFPNANTLIVDDAERYGLAELHQLRGRVGRSTVKAYAYFLIRGKVGKKAQQRLKALATYHHLGSGLKIALADLDIRGAGNLLGKEQHGHGKTIGYHLFFRLLEEAIRSLTGEAFSSGPEIRLVEGTLLIPEDYIEEPEVRVAFYRRIFEASTPGEVDRIEAEMRDRFGPIPPEALWLLRVARARIRAAQEGFQRVLVYRDRIELERGRQREVARI